MKQLLLFMFTLSAMTARAQSQDSQFYYSYDHEAKTATVTYKRGGNSHPDGGSYSGECGHTGKSPQRLRREIYWRERFQEQ